MRTRRIAGLLALLGLVLSPSGPLGADERFDFEIITLQRPGLILLARTGDLNGDGAPDLFLFHKPSRESYRKFCSVYLQQEDGFHTEPSLQIPLEDKVSAVDVKDIDGDGAEELFGFDVGGITLYEWKAGSVRSRRMLEYHTILPPVSRGVAGVEWVADLGSDGATEVVLPIADGLRVFRVDGFGLAEALILAFPVRGAVRNESGQNYITYRLPKLQFEDFDGDGRTDVGAFDLEEMHFFLTDGKDMPGRHIKAPLVRKFTKDYIGASDFRDLDSDGLPDAVVMFLSQKKNLESEVQIYFAREGFEYGDRPDHVYSGDANLILPLFFDATGDGKMEMLLQDIHVGIGFFLNYFLANRIRVDTELRTLADSGRYEEKPSLRRAIYVKVSETGTEPARGAGDFNGDGLDDLVVGTSENRLSFFLADPKTVLPSKPNHQYEVPAYGSMSTLNLNRDGRTDLIILYTDPDKEGLATLLLSR